MKLLIMSDLHTEFGSKLSNIILEDLEYDALVMAGDVGSSLNAEIMLGEISKMIFPKMLFYVTGNHDFYHGDVNIMEAKIAHLELMHSNFKFLNNQVVQCSFNNEDIFFVGATGWQTDENYTYKNYSAMNDFRLIANHKETVNMFGNNEFEMLKDSLEELKGDKDNGYKNKVVVVTHIPPTIQAIDRLGREAIDKGKYIFAYYNNHDELIYTYRPKLWVCGHMHDSIDTMVGETRIIRNAHGYHGRDRMNKNFNNKLIVEV